MKSLGVQPDETVFKELFFACSNAPHWVHGYQHIIFDAMSLMEGIEIPPTRKIYDMIIFAFGKAGDAVAAEYYYWEMVRKGFTPSCVTYTNLLEAYGRAQIVGARNYSSKGRYTRRKPQPLSEEEQAALDAGPIRVAQVGVIGGYRVL